MKHIFFLLILGCMISCQAQNFQRISVSATDPDELYVNDQNSTELFYDVYLPSLAIKGVLVILPSGGETVENTLLQIKLHQLAVERGVLVVVPSINWGTESRSAEFEMLNRIFSEIVNTYKAPKGNFVIGGLSNGAMISLLYAENAVKNPDDYFLIPKGVFALDAPLDEARFYRYCEREIERNISPAAVGEANWMKNNADSVYGGPPDLFPEKYIAHSIYSFGAPEGGNAKYLKNMPLLMFTDLDTDWLINERHRDLYDWNGIDIISMINQLNMHGNKNARVIVSHGKGVRLDGSRNPHSWSIMDNQLCVNWVVDLLES
jgi:hypothetical protein